MAMMMEKTVLSYISQMSTENKFRGGIYLLLILVAQKGLRDVGGYEHFPFGVQIHAYRGTEGCRADNCSFVAVDGIKSGSIEGAKAIEIAGNLWLYQNLV